MSTTGSFEVFDALFQVVDIVDACLAFVSTSSFLARETEGLNLTCKIASLCISCPVQAGIISFNVVNSSFILDLRLRSIKLCAVFLAIFLPAALVALGCFFLPPFAGAGALFDAAAAAAAFPDSFDPFPPVGAVFDFAGVLC